MSETAPLSASELRDLVPFAVMLGIEIDEAGPDLVKGHLPWSPERCTAGGTMHGGALMSLADCLGGICAFLNLPPGARTATISSATVFLRAIRSGAATGVTQRLHTGRSVIAVRTDLFDDAGQLAGQVTQSQAVLAPG